MTVIFGTELKLKPGKNNLLTFLFVCLFLDYSLGGHDIGPHVVAVCQDQKTGQFPPVEGAWIRAYVTPRNLREGTPYAHDKSFRREGFNGKFRPTKVFSLISTSLGDLTAMESQIMDSRFPCVNNFRFMIFSLLSDRILPQTHLQQSVMLAQYFKLTFR